MLSEGAIVGICFAIGIGFVVFFMFKCTGRYLGKKKYNSLEEEQHETAAKALHFIDAPTSLSLFPPRSSGDRGGGVDNVEILGTQNPMAGGETNKAHTLRPAAFPDSHALVGGNPNLTQLNKPKIFRDNDEDDDLL